MFKQTGSRGESISTSDFYEYLKDLASEHDINTNMENVEFLNQFDNNQNGDSTFSELDQPISIDEIVSATKWLKNNKSCSHDNILYEYFKESINVTAHSLQLLFSHILCMNQFPHSWSWGVIIPLFKKGDSLDTNNY